MRGKSKFEVDFQPLRVRRVDQVKSAARMPNRAEKTYLSEKSGPFDQLFLKGCFSQVEIDLQGEMIGGLPRKGRTDHVRMFHPEFPPNEGFIQRTERKCRGE